MKLEKRPIDPSRPRGLRLCLLGALAVGCQAGYPPADVESALWNDEVAARTAAYKQRIGDIVPPRDLLGRLLLTEADRVLVDALEAHGGWSAWLDIPGLRYIRKRTIPGAVSGRGTPEGQGTGASRLRFELSRAALDSLYCPCDVRPHPPHFVGLEDREDGDTGLFGAGEAVASGPVGAGLVDAGALGAGGPEDRSELAPATSGAAVVGASTAGAIPPGSPRPGDIGEEFFLLALPFLLQDPGILREYVGVEEDLAAAVLFERVRYTWSSPGGDLRLVAWYDRTTGLLRRILLRDARGRSSVVVFSGWKDVGEARIPTRREIHHVPRLHARWDPERPAAIDELESFLPWD